MVAMAVEYLPPELEAAPWLGNAPTLRELPPRPLTVDDLERIWEQLPEGYRLELDEGVLIVYGAPFDIHQLASGNLFFALRLVCPPEFLVIPAAGVEISKKQFRIPDLKVIRTETFGGKYSTTPPELVVEIASPSTARQDRTRKMEIYAEFGIPEYWIVTPDPEKPEVTVHRLDGGQYRQVQQVVGDEVFTATRPFRVQFTPAQLVSTGLGNTAQA